MILAVVVAAVYEGGGGDSSGYCNVSYVELTKSIALYILRTLIFT